MPRHSRRIDDILGASSDRSDTSLRKQAMDRASGDNVPTTLTPWEWQQWYEQHGMPKQFALPKGSPWYERLRKWLGRKSTNNGDKQAALLPERQRELFMKNRGGPRSDS